MLSPKVFLLLTGLALCGCFDSSYEKSVPPTVEFSVIQLTDSSATLEATIVKKGTAYYSSEYDGIGVLWDTMPYSPGADYGKYLDLEAGGVTHDTYEVTLDSLAPSTTYYINSYHNYNEWTIGGGSSAASAGKEDFSFTTLPN